MDRAQSLWNELRDYRPADAMELQHCRDLAALLRSGEACFSRGSFEPGHVTASCFITDGAGRLLLHHHKRLGKWLQMGGHVEAGERPIDAALREGAEESGLADLEIVGTGIVDIDVHVIPAGRGEPPHRHFDVRFAARTAASETIAIDASESEALAWFEIERAIAVMNEEGAGRAIRKIGMLLRERTR